MDNEKKQEVLEERWEVYLSSLDHGNGPLLDELEREALSQGIPIIRPAMQRLLKVLLAAVNPERILEIGTATGFSAILMAENTRASCQIVTIERAQVRAASAEEHFRRYERLRQADEGPERFELHRGDAADILPILQDSFDFVFMDAAKGQYLPFLPEVLRVLRPGGMLVSDNVLQEGDLLESHFIVERRDRTIYRRMRAYLKELSDREDLTTVILPVADGVAVSVKKA